MLLFNRYEYDPQKDMLGKGGFSTVYKALDTRHKRYVALKFYTISANNSKYDLITEINRVIDLDHPNICRYFDAEQYTEIRLSGEEEATQVAILELLDKGDIAGYLQKKPSALIRKKLLIDVLQGLAYLHKHGVIHRDIKPANILIKEDIDGPVAKIVDFGISKDADSSQNKSSAVLGSIEYMAPEQFNTEKYGVNGKIGTNLDLWAFGIMVYELIGGVPFFGSRATGDSSEKVMHRILSQEIVEQMQFVPESYRQMLERCLVKDANKRVQSAEELLDIFRSSNNIEAKVPVGATEIISLVNLGAEVADVPPVIKEENFVAPVKLARNQREPSIELQTPNSPIVTRAMVTKWAAIVSISMFTTAYFFLIWWTPSDWTYPWLPASAIRLYDVLYWVYPVVGLVFSCIVYFSFRAYFAPEKQVSTWQVIPTLLSVPIVILILGYVHLETEYEIAIHIVGRTTREVALSCILSGNVFILVNSYWLSQLNSTLSTRFWLKLSMMLGVISLLLIIPITVAEKNDRILNLAPFAFLLLNPIGAFLSIRYMVISELKPNR